MEGGGWGDDGWRKEGQAGEGLSAPQRGQGGRGGGWEAVRMERSTGTFHGDTFQVPSPRPGCLRVVSATLRPRRSSAACLADLPLGLGLFKISILRPLSTSQPRTSPSTSMSQVRRPGRGVEGGVGWCARAGLGSPACLRPDGTATRPCPRRDSVPAAALLQAQVLRAAAAAPQLHQLRQPDPVLRGARGLQLGLQHHAHQDLALQRHRRREVRRPAAEGLHRLLWQPRQPAGGLLGQLPGEDARQRPVTGRGWGWRPPARETRRGDSRAGSGGWGLWGCLSPTSVHPLPGRKLQEPLCPGSRREGCPVNIRSLSEWDLPLPAQEECSQDV